MNIATQRNQLLMVMTWTSIVLFIAASIMAFAYPGPDLDMGEVQRIFYVHLGSFFGAFLAFFAAVVGGIAYLRTRNEKWDHLGLASVEIGLGLSAVTIVTGAIWAKPTWGAYWTWDPRLTTISIMWLVYAAYLFLRSAVEDPDQQRRFAAVYGILAFGSVLLTVIIIRIRPDAIHPVVVGPTVAESEASQGDFGLSDRITATVLFNVFSYLVIATTLIWHRVRLQNRTEKIRARKMEILGQM